MSFLSSLTIILLALHLHSLHVTHGFPDCYFTCFTAVQRQSTKDDKIAFGPAVISAPVVCEETGGDMRIGGPYWSGPIHDQWVADR